MFNRTAKTSTIRQLHIAAAAPVAAAVAFAAGTGVPAGGQWDPPEITFVKVMDHVDKDGDGYSQSIRFQIRGNTVMNEKGRELKPLQSKGNPLYTVEIPVGGELDHLTVASKRVPRDGDAVDYLTISWSDLKSGYDQLDPSESPSHERDRNRRIKSVLKEYLDGTPIRAFDVRLYEDDEQPRYTPFRIFITGDKPVDTYSFDADRLFRLESPEDDQSRTFYVNTMPWGATLYINGEEKGTTPWGTQAPIDYAERNSDPAEIRLEKDGYETVTVEESVNPPHVVEIELDKEYAMGTIRPEPSSAAVYVNGELVGTGVSGQQYWVKEDLDIVVEDEGRKTKRITGVHAPFDKTISLELTDAVRQRVNEQMESLEDARKGDVVSEGKDLEGELANERFKDVAQGDLNLDLGDGDADADQAQHANFAGSWSSDYGTLHLRQAGRYVVGDYDGRGVLVGTLEGNTLAGVFTNDNRHGVFRFEFNQDAEHFDGQWAWHGDELDGAWDGERVSADLEGADYAGFTRDGDGINAADRPSHEFPGLVYTSPLGDVELIARDGILIGDIGENGVLAGIWDGDSYVGKFVREGRTGWFDLRFSPEEGTFHEGAYAWLDDTPETVPGDEWSPETVPGNSWQPRHTPARTFILERIDRDVARLTNMRANIGDE